MTLEQAQEGSVPRRSEREQLLDCIRCARTCGRIALRYEEDARGYEATGNHRLYVMCSLEARNYRHRARGYLNHARRFQTGVVAANSNRRVA